MMRKSLCFTDNQITMKWNKKIELLQALVSVKYKKLLYLLCSLSVSFFAHHYVKRVQTRIFFFGSYFPGVRLNTDIYSVNLCTQSKHRKIRTRIISIFGHFHAVHLLCTVSVTDFKPFLRKKNASSKSK